MERIAIKDYDELDDGELVIGFAIHVLRWEHETMGKPMWGIIPVKEPLADAAPDLLAACKAARAALVQQHTYPADIEAAVKWLSEAIAKAEEQ